MIAMAIFARAFLLREELQTCSYPVLQAMVATSDPQSFKEAVRGQDKDAWMKAMNSEMESLIQNRVFDLVPLPSGKKAIGCRWHYKTKPSVGSSPERKKARLVAKGYLQRKGIDYQDTYAPSTRHETIRLVLSRMASESWDSCQMDVMTAFLNSLLREEVYLKQPEGFLDKDHPDGVWRVRASFVWAETIPTGVECTFDKRTCVSRTHSVKE